MLFIYPKFWKFSEKGQWFHWRIFGKLQQQKNGTFCFEVVSSFRQVRKNQNFLSESDHEVDINPSKPVFLFQDSLSTVQAAVQDLLSFQTIFHCVVFFAAGPSQGKTSVLCTSLKSWVWIVKREILSLATLNNSPQISTRVQLQTEYCYVTFPLIL